MYDDLMIDIESLGKGNKHDFVILSLGAVAFNLDDDDTYETLDAMPEREFYRILNVPQQVAKGLTIDYSTIHWWMNQNAQARLELFGDNTPYEDVPQSLHQFNAFIEENECQQMWGNGNEFDISAVRNLYDAFGAWLPFKFPDGRTRYGNEQNQRTLKYIVRRLGGDTNHHIVKGIEHHALHDARFQVLVAQNYYRQIGGG